MVTKEHFILSLVIEIYMLPFSSPTFDLPISSPNLIFEAHGLFIRTASGCGCQWATLSMQLYIHSGFHVVEPV
jgi:hypothetical protein